MAQVHEHGTLAPALPRSLGRAWTPAARGWGLREHVPVARRSSLKSPDALPLHA